ncbi:alpha/beta fold hydrolase [Streptomyces sp. AC495_CC817]|uniref:alpha/beta fold hydrolase n=1 Tax=Streptomyces sp. AC495_CC817 TaxID=2823900 RepID=UPI001C2716FC|nr:alpha/beta hydrolase [Streptomyces sp. AC495_CC817]
MSIPVRRREIRLPSASVSLCEWSPPAPRGLPVLLLHGGGTDSAELSWGEVAPALAAAGHRVVAPDHPGFGRSARAARPFTQERLVAYVGELVDALELDRYVIGGLSLGGGMTIGHLLDRPGSAAGAVLLGAYGFMPRLADGPLGRLIHTGSYALVRSGLLTALTRSYARDRRGMERALRTLVRDPRSRTPALVDAVIAEAEAGGGIDAFGEWQRDQVRFGSLRTDYTAALPAVDAPTLLIHGELDGGVPLDRARRAASLLPRGELLTVPGAGHWVQRDRPDIVIPAMIEWLGGREDGCPAP